MFKFSYRSGLSIFLGAAFGFVGLLPARLLAQSVAAPQESERGFITDRPGATDNPKTANPGDYRLESNAYALEKQSSDQGKTSTTTVGNFNLAAGVNRSTEVQIGIDGYKWMSDGTTMKNGIGSIQLRSKFNVLGNDGGSTAVGLIPKLVYNSQFNGNRISAGVALPVNFDLPLALSLSIEPQFEYLGSQTSGTHVGSSVPIVFSFDATERLTLFAQEQMALDQDGQASFLHGAGVAFKTSTRFIIDTEIDYGDSNQVINFKYLAGFSYGL